MLPYNIFQDNKYIIKFIKIIFLLLLGWATAVALAPLERHHLASVIKFPRLIDGEKNDINACGMERQRFLLSRLHTQNGKE